jgi:hypothetical protein
MNFNYKNQRSLIIISILFLCLILNCTPQGKTLEEKITDPRRIESLAFSLMLRAIDFNQFCPPTDQIPILEPGNHNVYLDEGQSYLFDNRARFDSFTSGSDGRDERFTFIFQENPGQDVRLESPYCGQSVSTIPSRNDSGLKGQLETVQIELKNPFEPGRSGYFVRLTSIISSGTILLTTPITRDPRN